MSGTTKATIVFSIMAFVLYAALTFMGTAWCTPLLAVVLGLSAGYVGANLDKPDASKTARIARNSGKSGLIAGIAGLVGQLAGGWIATINSPTIDGMGTVLALVAFSCLGVVSLAVFTFFGWLGGWSWARHEHERQTGYKPT
jgi:nitrate/nitrite transporter NarK